MTALRAGAQHVLVVAGEADLNSAGQLRDQLIAKLQSGPPSVLVELGALHFCDLPGLDALHDAERAAYDAGVTLIYRGMSAQLSWLHRTFPPRPLPPPSTPRPAASVRSRPDAATGAPSATAPTPDARRQSVQTRRRGAPTAYLAGRDGRRRGTPDGLVHAVPLNDTSRSAACGARAQRSTTPWDGSAPDSCPDCDAAVATGPVVGTVHPISAPRSEPPSRHPQALQLPAAGQQVS